MSWPYMEVLKVVFPLLDGPDLAACICVCRQWRDIGTDEYFWKCLCAEKWPSICKEPHPPSGFRMFYASFSRRPIRRTTLPPRLSFDDLEFYIDFWSGEKNVFSGAIPGSILQEGIHSLPVGVSEILSRRFESSEYKLRMTINPAFPMVENETISSSVLVHRRDTKKYACIIHNSKFDYADGSVMVHASEYPAISPLHPFVSGIRAWLALLLMEDRNGERVVFGIEMDFAAAATCDDEALWILDMLDWK